MSILSKLNQEIPGMNTWVFSICTLSFFAFCFDVYQIFVSPNKFLAVVSIACLFVGLAATFKWATQEFSWYFLIYLVPLTLYAFSMIPNGELIGIDSGDFILSAWATVGSTLLPPVGTLITVPIVVVLGAGSRWLESKM
jgi:hypothetical protein